MKKKSKLIMGLALGAIMATTPLITGCSSDIKFNQSDLDNLISNADTYLTAQNNYSSEYAKNVLSDYLIRGISRVSSQEQHYSEDRDATDQTQKYTKEDFTNESVSIEDICSDPVYTLQYLYSQLLSSVINPEVSFLINARVITTAAQSNIIMEKSDDCEIFKFSKYLTLNETSNNSSMFCNYEITCKDGVIKKIYILATDGDHSEAVIYDIEENIGDFTFDKTPFGA